MENKHPIENLMLTAMSSIENMVDVNTIIGDPIETFNNIVIIPISKVSFGFAAGGSEFNEETVEEYTKKDKEDEEIKYTLPFGGGSGAGVSINPVAFLIVQDGNVKLLPVNHLSTIDKLLDYVPDLLKKVENKMCKCKKEEEDTSDKIRKEIINKKEEKKTNYKEKNKDINPKEEEYEIEYQEDEDLDD